MSMLTRIHLMIGCLLLALNSCDQGLGPYTGSQIRFYLLESYELSDAFGSKIDESTAVCEKIPFITYEELLAYNPDDYTFRISEDAKARIIDSQDHVARRAFGVTAGSELIYTGYFWPGYLSSSCDWVVIDPLSVALDNVLEVRLGYPGTINGVVIPDKRNDRRLLEIFRRDGKLIE